MSPFAITKIGGPEQWLIEAAASVGLDFSGFRHETTDDFKRHVIKRHGNPSIHGRAVITDADFTRIPDIIKTPDTAIIGAARKGRRYIIYTKNDKTDISGAAIVSSGRA